MKLEGVGWYEIKKLLTDMTRDEPIRRPDMAAACARLEALIVNMSPEMLKQPGVPAPASVA